MDNPLKDLHQIYVSTFKHSESGKKVLEDLEKQCFYNHTTLSSDSLEMAFREGMRMVFLRIKNMADESILTKIQAIEKEVTDA